MKLTYTLNGHTREGMAEYHHRDQITEGQFLVIVSFDGEPELWIVEGEEGMKALMAHYGDEWGPDRVTFRRFAPAPEQNFWVWKSKTHAAILKELNIDSEFLPDYDYKALYESGLQPHEACDYVAEKTRGS